jgi:hypothetical protein
MWKNQIQPRVDSKLSWFVDWCGRGFPVRDRASGKLYFLPARLMADAKLVNDDMIIVADSPDLPNNQLSRKITLMPAKLDELEVDE